MLYMTPQDCRLTIKDAKRELRTKESSKRAIHEEVTPRGSRAVNAAEAVLWARAHINDRMEEIVTHYTSGTTMTGNLRQKININLLRIEERRRSPMDGRFMPRGDGALFELRATVYGCSQGIVASKPTKPGRQPGGKGSSRPCFGIVVNNSAHRCSQSSRLRSKNSAGGRVELQMTPSVLCSCPTPCKIRL